MTKTSCLRVLVVFPLVLLLALAWRHVYADQAYGYFQAARALAAGQPATLSPAPLYILLLALAARLGLPLPPTALVLGALGWALAVTAWLEAGWRLDRPAFGVITALFLALHPLQGRTLGLETGPALGLVSLSLLWAMGPRTSPQRTQGAQRLRHIFSAFFALSAVGMMPSLAPGALLVGAGWGLWRRARPSLAHIAPGVALLAGLLALETALLGAWRDIRLLVPLTVAVQVLVAAGLAAAMARTVRPLALLAAVVLCIGQANLLLQEWRLRPDDHLALYARVAQWVSTQTLPTDVIGAPSPGLLGYLSQRPVLALPSWNPARSAAEYRETAGSQTRSAAECRETAGSQARSAAECRETAGSQARSAAECRETAGSQARSAAECRETAGSQARSVAECRSVDVLLAWLDSHRPDFLLVPAALPWQLIQGQPWFQEHYRQVHRELNPYEPASSLQVYQYIPSPFDVGETVSSTLAFAPAPGQQLELTAYRLDSPRLIPGQPVHLTLYWRAATPLDQPLRLTLYLRPETGGSPRKWAETAAPGGLPTHLWTPGVTVTDRYLLFPPADLPVGRYHLELALHLPNGQPVCREAVRSQVQSVAECRTVCSQARSEAECRTVCSQARSEAECRLPLASLYRPATVSTGAPQPDHSLRLTFGDGIELVGYDAPDWAVRGEPFRVALYWHAVCSQARSAAECRAVCSQARSAAECRAGPISTDYKVFVHLLTADGRLLAQDDSEPVAWTYPTSRWRAGEYIMDEHWLILPPDAPRGVVWLSVGLYDPASGERLPAYDEGGTRLPEDRAVLRSIRVY